MKHFIIIATLLVSVVATAQTNYEKGMLKAFELWGDNKPTEAANMFERIAAAEPDNLVATILGSTNKHCNKFWRTGQGEISIETKKRTRFIKRCYCYF